MLGGNRQGERAEAHCNAKKNAHEGGGGENPSEGEGHRHQQLKDAW